MNKLIEGLNEVMEIAKCDHDWGYNLTGTARRCSKCKVQELDRTGQFNAHSVEPGT